MDHQRNAVNTIRRLPQAVPRAELPPSTVSDSLYPSHELSCPAGSGITPEETSTPVYDSGERPTKVPDTFTVEEAARLLRVSARTIRRRIARYEAGEGSAWPTHVIRIGRIIRIPGSELRAVLRTGPAA